VTPSSRSPLEDLLATKLNSILDRAEAKDYRGAAMLAAGVPDLPIATDPLEAAPDNRR